MKTQEVTSDYSAIPSNTQQPQLPAIVRKAYDISPEAEVEKLSGGLVNEALVVDDHGIRTVLRRLSPVLSTTVIEDSTVVGDHLIVRGWEAPKSLPTNSGELYVRDDSGSAWHQMNYIVSDGHTPTEIDSSLATQGGELLATWHSTIRSLDYTPRFKLDHFHDTTFQAHKTAALIEDLPDTETRSLGLQLIEAYRLMPTVSETHKQIIHGDPKLDNMLFRNGRPFTLIDFDTVMVDEVWTDVGDFLRSLTSKLLSSAAVEPAIQAVVSNYHEASEPQWSSDQTTNLALRATQRIALELGMRYLCDIYDGEQYFSWDAGHFKNRRDNHYSRASLQLQVAKYIVSLKMT